MNKQDIDANIILEAVKLTNEGVTISDAQLPDYPLIYVNKGFEKMTGYLILPRKNGHLTKRPFLFQTPRGFHNQSSSEVVFDCSIFQCIQTPHFL